MVVRLRDVMPNSIKNPSSTEILPEGGAARSGRLIHFSRVHGEGTTPRLSGCQSAGSPPRCGRRSARGGDATEPHDELGRPEPQTARI